MIVDKGKPQYSLKIVEFTINYLSQLFGNHLFLFFFKSNIYPNIDLEKYV